jgi:hypothetical protein
MVVTAWRNGTPNRETGSGFGVRIRKADRNEHFHRDWDEVCLLLEGEDQYRSVSVSGESFWHDCPELRSQAIGQWFLLHGLSDWPPGYPPEFTLTRVVDNHFTLSLPRDI